MGSGPEGPGLQPSPCPQAPSPHREPLPPTDGRKFPFLFSRTSSPSGPLPCRPSRFRLIFCFRHRKIAAAIAALDAPWGRGATTDHSVFLFRFLSFFPTFYLSFPHYISRSRFPSFFPALCLSFPLSIFLPKFVSFFPDFYLSFPISIFLSRFLSLFPDFDLSFPISIFLSQF